MRHARDTATVVLMPGDFFVGDSRHRPRTLLGSCVSITLWHGGLRIGAMSHFLLSTRGTRGPKLDGRYGDEALLLMLGELTRLGVKRSDCVAKIFGGASMLVTGPHDILGVGQKNGITARRLLREHGIPVVSESLYGYGHRNIIFDIASGDVWSRQVKPAESGFPESAYA